MSVSGIAEKEYEELKKSILNFIATRNNRCAFEELEAWSREHTLPRLTLRIAINDLMESGDIVGSPELFVGDDFAPWVKIPAELSLKKQSTPAPVAKTEPKPLKKIESSIVEYDQTEPNLRRAIEYLNDYPSVGIMRFNIDLQSLQVAETDRILKKLSDEGFVEVSPLGVVNATPRLPKMTRNVTLGDLISAKT